MLIVRPSHAGGRKLENSPACTPAYMTKNVTTPSPRPRLSSCKMQLAIHQYQMT